MISLLSFGFGVFAVAQLLSCVCLSVTHGLRHARLPCPCPSPRACSNVASKETATHSSILARKISWIEEIGVIQSMGLQKVGHDWETKQNSNNILELNIPENLPVIFVPVKKCIFFIIKSNTCIAYLMRIGTSFCLCKLTLNTTRRMDSHTQFIHGNNIFLSWPHTFILWAKAFFLP